MATCTPYEDFVTVYILIPCMRLISECADGVNCIECCRWYLFIICLLLLSFLNQWVLLVTSGYCDDSYFVHFMTHVTLIYVYFCKLGLESEAVEAHRVPFLKNLEHLINYNYFAIWSDKYFLFHYLVIGHFVNYWYYLTVDSFFHDDDNGDGDQHQDDDDHR